uniref:Uncharacterized protein n=1 Tax=Panagrolaimus davidi TaxID=227884 RepID=A0A914Q7M7_9BILA
MDCNIKYICPQIYQILFDPEYISKNRRKQRIYLNIAKNDDLKTSTFIPRSIWPIARASEVPNDEHLYDLEYDGFGMLVHTKESAIYSTIVSNTKTLNKTEKRKVIYDFKEVKESVEELKTICKCCGYCSPKNAKIHKTLMIEQLMMMGCTFVVAKEELLEKSPFFINRPGWHAGKWKAIIRTRMCEICKEDLKKTAQTANDLYESYIKNEKEEKMGIEQKKQRLDENDVIDGTLRPPQELQPSALTMNTYSDPQTSVNVPQQITIILHYSYPTEKFLREKCEIFNIPFQKYPFHACESSYNSSIHNSIPLNYGKIERDGNSGYKALSFLLTGSIESYNVL